MTETATPIPHGIRERLAARKRELEAKGLQETTLPESGEAAFYPAFVSHGTVMRAQRFSGRKNSRTPFSAVLVAMTCRFGPERETLTADQVVDLLEHADIMHLFDLVYSGESDDEGDGEGN